MSPCPAVTWAVVLTHHLLALHPVLTAGQLAAAATEHLSPPGETVPRARRGERLQDGSLATWGGKEGRPGSPLRAWSLARSRSLLSPAFSLDADLALGWLGTKP